MITAIVLTKNNSKTLDKTLKSLGFSSEIVVIDDFSKDATISVAKKYKARVFRRKLEGDFASQRNFGLSKAEGDWVLFVDSDEIITEALGREIKQNAQKVNYNGFYIPRSDNWLGKEIKYGETNINLLRLAKKGSGKWKRKVHEFWDVKGKVGTLNGKIIHNSHPSVRDFISEVNVYSQIHGREIEKEGKRPSIVKVLLFPALKFKKNFIFKRGFRDGVHGLVIAGIMSFHSFLSWSNLWLTSRKK